jgi:hypothetical protein
MTADQRKELEALEAEMRSASQEFRDAYMANRDCRVGRNTTDGWADRIAAVLADGVEE